MADATSIGFFGQVLAGVAAHAFELLSAVAVAAVTSFGTFAVTRVKLRADMARVSANAYEKRHDKLMLADAQDRSTFRAQLMKRLEVVEQKLASCNESHARASETINEQQRHIYHLQGDLDRLVSRVNEMGRVSQFSDLTDIPGLVLKGHKQ